MINARFCEIMKISKEKHKKMSFRAELPLTGISSANYEQQLTSHITYFTT